jgi:DNA-binding Lrp family transcriptional regulator
VFTYVQTHPITSIAAAGKQLGLSFPTVASAVSRLEEMGILSEITQRRRGRLFTYKSYLDILNEGAEPIR